MAAQSRASFRYHDLKPDPGSFFEEVVAGLSAPQKYLEPKHFYDPRGSRLFEAICRLPEYYPTRTEIAIMREHAGDFARRIGRGCTLIEYGCGSGRKTGLLIDALQPALYMPIDIAGVQLRSAAARLARAHPGLEVVAVCADYTRKLALPPLGGHAGRRRVIYFPGSTIGNFDPEEARRFMSRARRLAGPGGAMLIGVDLKKDPAVLHAAYNDARGVTAAFNLNLLVRINRELGADFNPSGFRHLAFYNAAAGRIEMHLESLVAQRVRLAGKVFRFRRGETIHTENSYKYSVTEFQRLARRAGYAPDQCWVDARALFSVHYLAAPR
jgi:dimethylhistidine N-methyltransferase